MAGCEGWSDTMDATDQIKKISRQEKPQVETMTGANLVDFNAVKYRNKHVRGGQNLLIKVHIGGEKYYHLSLFSPVDGKVQIRGVKERRTKEDEIKPFPI